MEQLGLSPGSKKQESRLRSFLWPDLSFLPEIDSAIHLGKLASYGVAIISIVGSILLPGITLSLIDTILFLGLGFGIAAKSRICAVLAFVLYGVGRVTAIGSMNSLQIGIGLWGVIVAIAVTIVLLNAIRATFAYHAHNRRMSLPVVPVTKS